MSECLDNGNMSQCNRGIYPLRYIWLGLGWYEYYGEVEMQNLCENFYSKNASCHHIILSSVPVIWCTPTLSTPICT